MNQQDFTRTITVAATPDQAYGAINDVRAWWSRSIVGESADVGDEFVQQLSGTRKALATAPLERRRVLERHVLALMAEGAPTPAPGDAKSV